MRCQQKRGTNRWRWLSTKKLKDPERICRYHERTTTAKNMGILKYHQTSLISYERGWPLACLEDLIKPNQASHQGARWTSCVSMLKVPVLALIIETSAVWPWCRRSFQYICRGLWIIYSRAYLWFISHDLSHGRSFGMLKICMIAILWVDWESKIIEICISLCILYKEIITPK
jgi:hypothetical protein